MRGFRAVKALRADAARSRLRPTGGPLTHRERLVMQVLALGATNREIAARLGLREQTIKNRLSTIYQKLGLRNRLELAVYLARMAELETRHRT
jgi:DNA-binding NarL/FixJ family response regulator